MIWYSVMPWEQTGGLYDTQAAAVSKEIRIEGILMEVEPIADDQAKIVRLLDCGLQDYLNPSYAPGCIIRYIPTLENEAKG